MDANKKHESKTMSVCGTSHPVVKDAINKAIASRSSLKELPLKKQLKAVIVSEFEPLISTETLPKDQKTANRPLPDPNKVNELDCLNNRNQSRPFPLGRTFLSQIMRTQLKNSPLKSTRDKTSPYPRSRRRIKKPLPDGGEEAASSHIKSIMNCLLENTLNLLDVKESSRLIADHIDDPVVRTPKPGASSSSNFEIVDLPSSTTSDREESDKNIGGVTEKDQRASADVVEAREKSLESDNSVTSREALFDPNSTVDLLEDMDISPLLHGLDSVGNISSSPPTNSVVLLGVRPLNEEDAAHTDGSAFPSWLLRILRNNFPENNHEICNEWAYFYSQGDGWGNGRPWLMRDDDESGDASSEESSTNDSLSFARADTTSSVQDVISLPDDSTAALNRNRQYIGHIRLHNEESDEYFDTVDNFGAVSR